MSGFVDVHSHVVPSGDDGARTIEEGLELCRLAFESGTATLFATPHAHAPWDTFPRTASRDALFAGSLEEMRGEVAGWGLDLRRGWEVYPSEVPAGRRGRARAGRDAGGAGRVPRLVARDRRCDRASSPMLRPGSTPRGSCRCSRTPSAASPSWPTRGACGRSSSTERCSASTRLRSSGATGRPPSAPPGRSLDAGLVALAASDGHSVSRPPVLDSAFEEARRRLGDDGARRLFDGSALPWVVAQWCGSRQSTGGRAGRLEEAVRAGEVTAAEEAVRRRVRRRVRGREHVVLRGVHDGSLLLRVAAPEEEDDPLAACRELRDDPVGEPLPPLARVRGGRARARP